MEKTINTMVDKYQKYFGEQAIREWYKDRMATIEKDIISSGENFIIIQDANKKNLVLLDTSSKLCWQYYKTLPNNTDYVENVQKNVSSVNDANLKNWDLPKAIELFDFAKQVHNPFRNGNYFNLFSYRHILCHNGCVDLDYSHSVNYYGGNQRHPYILVNKSFINKSLTDIIIFCFSNNFTMVTMKNKQKISNFNLRKIFDFDISGVQLLFKKIDYTSVRLPELTESQLTENNKGLWELFGLNDKEFLGSGIKAKNPADDIRSGSVAIDFGTSSTVVAIEENGIAELLRIGLKDFNTDPEPEHYENPTVLEFINLPKLLEAWKSQVYRPLMNWDYLKGAHEAKHNLHYNSTDIKVVSSILAKLKQWALRDGTDSNIILTDQATDKEHKLANLVINSPTKGVPLEIDDNYLFDPIEVYAWMLGMVINMRQRGIFLNYYMTFPVDYPRETKDKILSSFRRGIQRAFPASLTKLSQFSDFHVSEAGTEPAAYAASALKELNIPCTTEGSAYGVFDFGGGTTDFDFGIYRLPTDDEADYDYEEVIEHIYGSGDKFLGGENILENLAFIVFKDNISVCRQNKLTFTKPLNAQRFAGDELLIDLNSIASTNTAMMIGVLRNFWEKSELPDSVASSGILKITLINTEGTKTDCEFVIKPELLNEYIQSVIEQGVVNFFIALKTAFESHSTEEIHILLAGNSCKSKWITDIFDLADGKESNIDFNQHIGSLNEGLKTRLNSIFGKKMPLFKVYGPLKGDPNNIYAPTGKTGVALGLLKICPGGDPILVINHAIEDAKGEAPFLFFAGRIKQNVFLPILKQGDAYQEWKETGVVRDGYFNLVYTQSPTSLAGDLQKGNPILKEKKVKMTGNSDGLRVYIRAISPNEVELCTVAKNQHPDDNDTANNYVFLLD